ncbi:hypothetical protein BKA67DRAFT_678707 [Truncatella angustata]|uniref:Uncharacterized protein n=1 Tax=Truncatella angustata TaxID=152316 RepID=A0A9P8UJR5_9PEZI|nr:uncharacterized protein BKA67DRAFT_678707 [Truncatella angustata]KAH6653376.1 hypothetical protein BKA67DRAFT_678707 [Truncatella angustata]
MEVASMGPFSSSALIEDANKEKPWIEAHINEADVRKNTKLIALDPSKIVRANGTFRTSPIREIKMKTFPTMIKFSTEGIIFNTVKADSGPRSCVIFDVKGSEPFSETASSSDSFCSSLSTDEPIRAIDRNCASSTLLDCTSSGSGFRQPHKRWSALKCLAWLGSSIQAVSDSQNFNSNAHASPSNESATDRETILLAGGTVASPVESSKRRKRPASASLSEANYGLGIRSGGRPAELRSLRFSEDSHHSPEQLLPAPSLVLRQSSRDLPSTPTPRARFVTPPIPQSPGFRGSPSEIPTTLAPEVPFVTPPPPSPRPGRVPHHGALVYPPISKSYYGASFGGPLVSP